MKVTAKAVRSGGWWAVEVPEVAGGIHTQARRLEQVPGVAADAVADVLEIDAESVEVSVNAELHEAARHAVDHARTAAMAAARMQSEASAAMREAVATLRDDEALTTRDAATLLGVTHQRVAQLAHR